MKRATFLLCRRIGCILILLFFFRCLHDLSIPLENDTPLCFNAPRIAGGVNYPDSITCTLRVSDLNDSILSICVVPDTDYFFPDTFDDTADTIPWPGTVRMGQKKLGEKKLVVAFPKNTFGRVSGEILIRDEQLAYATLQCSLAHYFLEPFHTTEVQSALWSSFGNADSTHIRIDYLDKKLELKFDTLKHVTDTDFRCGIISRFGVVGDMSVSADFYLREGMLEGFETAFFISTANDSGLFSGSRAGFFLSGQGKWVRIKCQSINLQMHSREIDDYSGSLKIERKDTIARFFYTRPYRDAGCEQLASLELFSEDTVYIHIVLQTNDVSAVRNCKWDNILIEHGVLMYPALR